MVKNIKAKSGTKALVLLLCIVLAFSLLNPFSLGGYGGRNAFANISDTLDPDKRYRPDYDSLRDTERVAAELNIELASEGNVLLKNRNNALPITTSAASKAKVTVLGQFSDSLAVGGGGSGGQGRPGGGEAPAAAMNIFESLTAANFEYNEAVKTVYALAEHAPTRPASGNSYEGGHYMEKVDNATGASIEFDGKHYEPITDGTFFLKDAPIGDYKTALVVLSRTGSEGNDNIAYNFASLKDGGHYLELGDKERELMAYAKKNFDKVIVILNSPSAMELGCLEDDDGIGAVIWMGQPGWNGVMAIGKILNGEVNPSGRTVDFYMRDFATDPVWYNFGNSSQANAIINNASSGNGTNPTHAVSLGYDAAYALEGIANGNYNVLDYAEGIYLGYRYYETVYSDLKSEAGAAIADAWYNEAVVYPFGYGLSYTSFTQTIKSVTGNLSDKNGEVKVTVTVTNNGTAAGKEVVQLYSTPPYDGGIEKAAANLVGFGKTKMLNGGASEDVVITIAVKDLASFDYNDANDNENYGYELETGDYVLSIRKNSHSVLDSRTLNASALLTWDEDGDASTPNNIFSQKGNAWEMYNTQVQNWVVGGQDNYLRRDQLLIGSGANAEVALEEDYSNGNPNALQAQLGWLLDNGGVNNKFKKEAFLELNGQAADRAYRDYDNHLTQAVETDYINVWTKSASDIPAGWSQGKGVKSEKGLYAIQLADMTGVPLSDSRWTDFMNQLTWAEIVQVAGDGGYGSKPVLSIGKPQIYDNDGPGQLKAGQGAPIRESGYAWVCESVIGSTWNTDLAYKQGRIVGNETMFIGVNGWYGPGTNIHRNALSGRNFEYYSQDGVQGGLILAAVTKGVTDMGGHVYMKHAFLNDQETGRIGSATFATEQAIREIYAKPLEIAVKKGNSNGVMTSFNRIGVAPSASYGIGIHLYEKEWGLDGISVTDAYIDYTGWDSEVMIRGSILPLNSVFAVFPPAKPVEGVWDASLRSGNGGVTVDKAAGTTDQVFSPTQWYWARKTAQKALYTFANGNAMTGFAASMMLANKSIVLDKAKAYEGSNAVRVYSAAEFSEFRSTMLGIYGSADNYAMTSASVPAGMSYDNQTGVLSGTAPDVPGKYDFTVTATGKDKLSFIGNRATVSINVSEPVIFGEAINANYRSYNLNLTEANYLPGGAVIAANANKYISVEYEAEGLPAGLSINQLTGAITGTLTNRPEYIGQVYSFTLKRTAVQVQSSFGSVVAATTVLSNTLYMTAMPYGDYSYVTYNVNIPGYETAEVVTSGLTIADLVEPVAPIKGFKFLGWATAPNATEVLDGGEAIPQTLYAIWEYPPVTIINGTFWVNGEDTGISPQGQTGVGIASIESVAGANGIVVTVTLTNGQKSSFTIPNGQAGQDGQKGDDGQNGKDGKDGKSIVKIEKTKTEGNVDTYTITYSDNTTTTFTVTNAPEKTGGCNSSTAGAIMAGLIMMFGVVFVVKAKRN